MSRKLCEDLVKEISGLQVEARAALKPRDKSKPQCDEPPDNLGMYCSLDKGHEPPCEHYDPILGIV